MAYIIDFNAQDHIAFAHSCNAKHMMNDAMEFFNNRIFHTEAQMAESPEVQAYKTYFKAAQATYRFNNEAIYNQLMAEANSWKKSAIQNQIKLDDGEWLVDDGNGNIFDEFSNQIVTVDTEDFCDYIRVTMATDSYSRTFLVTNIVVDLGIITITVDNGDKIYLRLPKE